VSGGVSAHVLFVLGPAQAAHGCGVLRPGEGKDDSISLVECGGCQCPNGILQDAMDEIRKWDEKYAPCLKEELGRVHTFVWGVGSNWRLEREGETERKETRMNGSVGESYFLFTFCVYCPFLAKPTHSQPSFFFS